MKILGFGGAHSIYMGTFNLEHDEVILWSFGAIF